MLVVEKTLFYKGRPIALEKYFIFFKKYIDKYQNICYNIYVSGNNINERWK